MTDPNRAYPDDPSLDVDPWKPLGLALADHAAGRRDVSITVTSGDGARREMDVGEFFRDVDGLPDLEEFALSLCRGRVLDVGAGAGAHALRLQAMGVEVTAIDTSPEAVDVMTARGVRDARVADVFDFKGGPFDTVLMLMNGIGVVGTLAGLRRFLKGAEKLLSPGGNVLLDSTDLDEIDDPKTRAGIERRRREGRYHGEITYRITYRRYRGASYPWLFVDARTLAALAAEVGFVTQIVHEESGGGFLARLSPM